jgi:hypothetical protein
MHEAPLSIEWRFAVLRWSLASQVCGGRWLYPPSLLQALPAGISLFRGRSIGDCSCRASAFFGLAGVYSSSRYITGIFSVAIAVPFGLVFYFSVLDFGERRKTLQSGMQDGK